MQTSIDMFVGEKDGDMDWMAWSYGENWTWGGALRRYFVQTVTSADTILLSSRMAEQGYIDHWTSMADETKNPQSAFASSVRDAHKVLFAHSPTVSRWRNTEIAKNNLKTEVNNLKSIQGKNIIAFGGAGFAASLIQENLVDEYHFIVNPVVLGEGLPIFQKIPDLRHLELSEATSYSEEGIVVMIYMRKG
jgi:dihydrofolate reductase